MKSAFLILLFCILPALSAASAPSCDKAWSRTIIDQLLNRDLEAARQTTAQWEKADGPDFQISMYRAMLEVARADYRLERDPRKYDTALVLLEGVIRDTGKASERNAVLARATSQAVAGRLLMEQSSWLKAYRYGYDSRKTMTRLLEADPGLEDARLVLGLFDYFTGSLKGVMKWLSVLVDFSGDPAQGIEMLEQVIRKAQVAAPQAADSVLLELSHTPQMSCEYVGLAQLMMQRYPANPRYRRVVRRMTAACASLPQGTQPKPKDFVLADVSCP